MIFPSSWLFFLIYDHFSFCLVNVLSCRDNHFWICYLSFLQLVIKTLFLYVWNMPLNLFLTPCLLKKNNDNKNTFEIFYLHFELYCVRNDRWSVWIVNKYSKKNTSSFQRKETRKSRTLTSNHICFARMSCIKRRSLVGYKNKWKSQREIKTNQSSIAIDLYVRK